MNKNLTKKTNLELMNSVLTKIESYGYHIKDKKFGNCYFIFDGEANSICHFHIKEIPGFLFGLWHISRYDNIKKQLKQNGIGHTWADSLEISPLTEIIFFTQYERDLDKFKPSRSGFVTGLYREVWEESSTDDSIEYKEDWYDYNLENILKYMKHHHIKSAEYASLSINHIWDDDRNSVSILYGWIKDWYYYYKYALKDYLKYKKHIRVAKQLVKHLKFCDYVVEDKGSNWSPRIDIFVSLKSNVEENQLDYDMKILDRFDKKWFNEISMLLYTSTKNKQNKQFNQLIKNLIKLKKDNTYEGKIICTNVSKLL